MPYTYPISAGTRILSSSSILGDAPTAGGTATVKWCEYRTTDNVGGWQRQDLPAAISGLRYHIIQGAATSVRLCRDGGDTFRGLSDDSLMTNCVGSIVKVWCYEDGVWDYSLTEDEIISCPATVTTSGSGEQDLITTTLSRNTCHCLVSTIFDAAGIQSGGVVNADIKFYFGASSVVVHTGVLDIDWVFRARIIHYSSTEHRCLWEFTNGITGSGAGYISFSDNSSTAALTMKLTANVVTGGATVSQTMLYSRSSGGPGMLA